MQCAFDDGFSPDRSVLGMAFLAIGQLRGVGPRAIPGTMYGHGMAVTGNAPPMCKGRMTVERIGHSLSAGSSLVPGDFA